MGLAPKPPWAVPVHRWRPVGPGRRAAHRRASAGARGQARLVAASERAAREAAHRRLPSRQASLTAQRATRTSLPRPGRKGIGQASRDGRVTRRRHLPTQFDESIIVLIDRADSFDDNQFAIFEDNAHCPSPHRTSKSPGKCSEKAAGGDKLWTTLWAIRWMKKSIVRAFFVLRGFLIRTRKGS